VASKAHAIPQHRFQVFNTPHSPQTLAGLRTGPERRQQEQQQSSTSPLCGVDNSKASPHANTAYKAYGSTTACTAAHPVGMSLSNQLLLTDVAMLPPQALQQSGVFLADCATVASSSSCCYRCDIMAAAHSSASHIFTFWMLRDGSIARFLSQ
jgi:hypothetical protein